MSKKHKDGIIVDYKYKGEWKHTAFIAEYDGEPFLSTGNETTDAAINDNLLEQLIQNQKVNEITKDNVPCFMRIIDWEKSLEDLEDIDTDKLRGYVTTLCVVNEDLFKEYTSEEIAQ